NNGFRWFRHSIILWVGFMWILTVKPLWIIYTQWERPVVTVFTEPTVSPAILCWKAWYLPSVLQKASAVPGTRMMKQKMFLRKLLRKQRQLYVYKKRIWKKFIKRKF